MTLQLQRTTRASATRMKKGPTPSGGWGLHGGSGAVGRRPRSWWLRHVHLLVGGDVAQLLHDAHVQLTHALLGNAHLLADLLQRHRLLAAVQAGPHADDLP